MTAHHRAGCELAGHAAVDLGADVAHLFRHVPARVLAQPRAKRVVRDAIREAEERTLVLRVELVVEIVDRQ